MGLGRFGPSRRIGGRSPGGPGAAIQTWDRTAVANRDSADSRYELNTTGYLWDVYDNGDTVDVGYYRFIESINDLTNGTGNGDKNEPWNSAITSLDDRDGRSTEDFRDRMDTLMNISSSDSDHVYETLNCDLVGD